MTDPQLNVSNLPALLDDALSVVSDYGEVLRRAVTELRLRDLPHTPEIIKKAIFVLYSLIPIAAVQNLIQLRYPKEVSERILSAEYWKDLYVGIAKLPEFLPDSEAALRAAFMRRENLSDADILRMQEIEQRIHSEVEALFDEGRQWCQQETED